MSLRSDGEMLGGGSHRGNTPMGSLGSDAPLYANHAPMDIDELYDAWPVQSHLSGIHSAPSSAPKPILLDNAHGMGYEMPPAEYSDLPPLSQVIGYPQQPQMPPMMPTAPMMSMAVMGDQMLSMMPPMGATPHPSDKDPSSSTGGMGYSSPSASVSPPWSPPSNSPEGDGIDLSNLTDAHIFSVELLQKPRGSNGRWLAVEPAQRIRVAAKLGKMLKIVMRTPLPVDWESMRLIALERSVSGDVNAEEHPWRISPTQKEAFAILSKKVLDHAENADGQPVSAIQLDIKLFLVYRSISFLAEVTTSTGQTMRAMSVSLSTHNSGSSDNKRKRDRITADNDCDDSPQGPRAGFSPASPEEEDSIFSANSPAGGGVPVYPPASTPLDPMYPIHVKQDQQELSQLPPGSEFAGIPYSVPMIPNLGQERPWQVVPGNLQVEGVVRAHGYSQFSDIRLKTDIADIAEAMQLVQQLSGKTYKWKKSTGIPAIDNAEELSGGRRVIGLIAQEVQRVLPEVVQEGEDGYLAVNYAEIVPVLIEAFKEQVSHFKDVQAQVSHTLSKHAGHQDDLLIELGKVSQQIQKLKNQKLMQQKESEAGTGSSTSEDTSSSSPETSEPKASRNSRPRGSKTSGDSHSVEMQSLVKGKAQHTASAAAVKPEKKEAMSLAKAGLLIGLLAVAVGVTIFLGVFLGIRAGRSPTAAPPPASFASRNYAANAGFEDVDPNNALKAAGWLGDYTLHSYALTRKRAILANNWPLVSNASLYFDAGRHAIRMSIPLASANETTYAIAQMSQSINIAQLLQEANPTAQELAATTGIFVSVWCTTIYAPRDVNGNVTTRDSATNGTLPVISLTALAKDSSGALIPPRVLNLTKPLESLSRWHWQQHTLYVELDVRTLHTMEVFISSSVIGDVFFDNVGVYFNYNQPPAA